jgi:hypothetical protein
MADNLDLHSETNFVHDETTVALLAFWVVVSNRKLTPGSATAFLLEIKTNWRI